jgi:DNA-binding Lrp family transcriptional regulator
MHRLDPIDARLLDGFQRDLPLTARPFAEIAAALGTGEDEVLSRLAALQARGAVARVGATVRPNTAGASTLAAMAVPEDRIEAVAAMVGAEPGVNHSYLREDAWNLWFVATASDARALEKSLARIAARSGLRVLDLRLVRAFNIDLGFALGTKAAAMPTPRLADPDAIRPGDRPILQALTEGLPPVPEPYAEVAHRLDRTEAEVTGRIAHLIEAGIITRLGVIVRHRAIGWTSNAMVVWDLPEARTDAAGAALAALPGISLCYLRRTVPGVWPYALYAMIHARSRPEALAVLDRAAALPDLAGAPHRALFSLRCFKQSGALLQERRAA